MLSVRMLLIKEFIIGIKGNPLISEAVAVNILAGATGSASGGMGIALEALGSKYYELALETVIPPEAFHRDSYKDIFVVAVLLPILSVIVAILFSTIGIY